MSVDRTDLSKLMHALADTGHERAAELREKADAFDAAAAAFFSADAGDVKKMLGCWARARRLYSDCTGEPLIG